MLLASMARMRVLIVSREPWVATSHRDLEVHRAADVAGAGEVLEEIGPELTVIDPSVSGTPRGAILAMAQALGLPTIAAPPTLPIPGSTIQALEKHAIIETLRAVGGSTRQAAAILGISTRKIQYRMREWQTEMAEIKAGTALRAVVH